MEWTEIKTTLLRGTSFDLTISGGYGASKRVDLTMMTGSTPGPLTFTTLGTGSMKRVVRVNNEDWVLALAGDSPGAAKDIRGEVDTLKELHGGNVRVPSPFNSISPATDIIFPLTVYNTDSGDEKAYPVFLQQFLSSPTWVEMAKLDKKEDFAKNKIVAGGRVPPTIDTTVTDLNHIMDFFNRVRVWGDFQVFYNSINGQVVVFDPLPNNDGNLDFKGMVRKWLSDIEEAREARRTPPPLVRSKSVGSLPGTPPPFGRKTSF